MRRCHQRAFTDTFHSLRRGTASRPWEPLVYRLAVWDGTRIWFLSSCHRSFLGVAARRARVNQARRELQEPQLALQLACRPIGITGQEASEHAPPGGGDHATRYGPGRHHEVVHEADARVEHLAQGWVANRIRQHVEDL